MTIKYNEQLVHQVNTLTVPTGQLAVWSLGQFGLIIKGGDEVIYVDPYLSDSIKAADGRPLRMFPPPLKPEYCSNARNVLLTHEHGDHTDIDTLMPLSRACPQATFLCNDYSREMLANAGLPAQRMRAATVGMATTLGSARITPTPAAHYGKDVDPVRGHRWLGFVIELNGVTLWHSGDTILFPELMAALAPWSGKIDVACLPVNGRDFFRDEQGIIGNIDATEALDLCAKLGVDVFVPMHNDLFAGNHVSPAVLAEYQDRKHPRRRYHWLQPGELYVYVK